jgi:hypothetical protein
MTKSGCLNWTPENCVYGCSGYVCLPPQPFCTDSDGGLNLASFGTVSFRFANGTGGNQSDSCNGNLLNEQSCSNLTPVSTTFNCLFSCSNGACLQSQPICTDTDGGKVYNVTGNVTYKLNGITTTLQDTCTNTTLTERYCTNTTALSINTACVWGCTNGRCLPAPVCTDSDGGLKPNIAGLVTVIASDGKKTSMGDFCGPTPSPVLWEMYCVNTTTKDSKAYNCTRGCLNGACI